MDYYEIANKIDILLKDKITPEKFTDLIDLIKNDTSFQDYFFKNVKSTDWFTLLKENGYFSHDNALSPVLSEDKSYITMPEWNVLPYLELISLQVNTKANKSYIDDLIEIISKVTEQHIDNYKTWWYFAKILCNLPTYKIDDEIIDLIPFWLDSKYDTSLQGSEIVEKLLPKFLNSSKPDDWGKAEKIIEIITNIKEIIHKKEERTNKETDLKSAAFKKALEDYDEFVTVIAPYYLLKSFKVNAVKVGEKCTEKVIFTIADRLNTILKQKYGKEIKTADLSYIWFSSLYSETDISEPRADRILVTILRDVLLSKAKHNTTQTKEIIGKFLSNDYKFPIFKRIILYVIGIEWESYKDTFNNMIKGEKGLYYFNDQHYRPELYKLLESNCKKFTQDEKERIEEIIEQDTQRDKDAENKEMYRAYRKQLWYFALKSDPKFKALYKKQHKIYPIPKDEIRPEAIYHRSFFGPGQSPFTKGAFDELSNEELAGKLKAFEQKEEWFGQSDVPTVGGLAEHLEEVAREMPDKFINDLNPFKDTGYIYVYSILSGIKDAWVAKKNIDWGKLFEFIYDYINSVEFEGDTLKVKYNSANHQWIIGIVAEMIQEGTRNDLWAFPENYLEDARTIIFLLLDKSEGNKDVKEITDYDFHTLNSPLGKSLKALVYLSLRIKRININDDFKWLFNKFDDILKRKAIEAYVSLGSFLPDLDYLDNAWVKDKVHNLEKYYNSEDVEYWEAFMDGLLYSGKVYPKLFDLMKPHYQYGISYYDKFKKDSNKKLLIQYICVYYLKDTEDISKSDSLFKQLINAWKPEQIIEIIDYFWMKRHNLKINKKENKDFKPKIIGFWKLIYKRYKKTKKKDLTADDKRILSYVSKLAIFLTEIDDEKSEWLKLSAPYVNVDYNSTFFIENLDELKDKGDKVQTAKYIGDIFWEMLNNSTPEQLQMYIHTLKDNIRSIVEFLYDMGTKENANKICNKYGKNSQFFLRDLYEKNNP
ncbi:MAG: hypothetical protein HQK92_04720 [Nitrospirae bacterium]|nr:hypothetical protein [Nitrospirota bacterium]